MSVIVSKPRALVTGGMGFIGSHIVDRLVEELFEVHCIDDKSAECNEKFYKNDDVSYYKADVSNFEDVSKVFLKASPHYVFHLAAESRIQPAIKNPIRACEVNFLGTCNILQASRKHKVARVIYSSTSAAYGLENNPPLKEEMKRDCLNPYSATKVAAEDLCRMYHSLYGLQTIILRYFNVFGERSPTKGQYAPVIGIFQRQTQEGKPLTVVGDGSQERDFIHVKDIVNANMLAMLCMDKEALGQIFNIGSGKSVSIFKLATFIDENVEFIPAREGEAENTLADISKARRILNFEPKIDVLEWIQDQN